MGYNCTKKYWVGTSQTIFKVHNPTIPSPSATLQKRWIGRRTLKTAPRVLAYGKKPALSRPYSLGKLNHPKQLSIVNL